MEDTDKSSMENKSSPHPKEVVPNSSLLECELHLVICFQRGGYGKEGKKWFYSGETWQTLTCQGNQN